MTAGDEIHLPPLPQEPSPSPWLAEVKGYGWIIKYSTANRAERSRLATVHHSLGQGHSRANALLIAAAPEMLEALRAARELFDLRCTVEDGAPVRVKIESSIAKAEGRGE